MRGTKGWKPRAASWLLTISSQWLFVQRTCRGAAGCAARDAPGSIDPWDGFTTAVDKASPPSVPVPLSGNRLDRTSVMTVRLQGEQGVCPVTPPERSRTIHARWVGRRRTVPDARNGSALPLDGIALPLATRLARPRDGWDASLPAHPVSRNTAGGTPFA